MENISLDNGFDNLQIYRGHFKVAERLWKMGLIPVITRSPDCDMITSELQEVIDESVTQYSVYLKTVERTHLPFRNTEG